MASLAYITAPPSATRLANHTTLGSTSDIRPAQRIPTSLPSPSSPTSARHRRTSSISPTSTASITSPTSNSFSLLPQLLLSSALGSGSLPTTPPIENTAREGKLLTTRDALSLPTTTNNFKRFVARVGPIFWLQDRIEEVVMWRRGWRVTGVWMAAYAFLCYFPKLILLIPHITLIGIILASYPYPNPPNAQIPPKQTPTSDSVNWQANLQAIQNLMGFVADTHDLVEPYTHHLLLSQAHFPASPPDRFMYKHTRTPSTPVSIEPPPLRAVSPYPPYILLVLLISLPPFLLLISSPYFPTRWVFLLIGLGPLVATCPPVRGAWEHIPSLLWVMLEYGVKYIKVIKARLRALHVRFIILLEKIGTLGTWSRPPRIQHDTAQQQTNEDEDIPLISLFERIIDDDKLSDKCWGAEMTEVELWENERFAGGKSIHCCPNFQTNTPPQDPTPPDSGNGMVTSPTTTSPPTSPRRPGVRPTSLPLNPGAVPDRNGSQGAQGPVDGQGWSKANLRPGERGPWTRGRDGWGGVGGGEVSSNLTFSLAPGWAFVPTEGWRQDRAARWAIAGGADPRGSLDPDEVVDGWIYTNDAWGDPCAAPYPGDAGGGGGSLTRRRRWVRRVWFDDSASAGGVA